MQRLKEGKKKKKGKKDHRPELRAGDRQTRASCARFLSQLYTQSVPRGLHYPQTNPGRFLLASSSLTFCLFFFLTTLFLCKRLIFLSILWFSWSTERKKTRQELLLINTLLDFLFQATFVISMKAQNGVDRGGLSLKHQLLCILSVPLSGARRQLLPGSSNISALSRQPSR